MLITKLTKLTSLTSLTILTILTILTMLTMLTMLTILIIDKCDDQMVDGRWSGHACDLNGHFMLGIPYLAPIPNIQSTHPQPYKPLPYPTYVYDRRVVVTIDGVISPRVRLLSQERLAVEVPPGSGTSQIINNKQTNNQTNEQTNKRTNEQTISDTHIICSTPVTDVASVAARKK